MHLIGRILATLIERQWRKRASMIPHEGLTASCTHRILPSVAKDIVSSADFTGKRP
jgi:hypothetical protein